MTPDDEQIVRKTYQMTTARRAEITPTPLQATGTPSHGPPSPRPPATCAAP